MYATGKIGGRMSTGMIISQEVYTLEGFAGSWIDRIRQVGFVVMGVGQFLGYIQCSERGHM